MTAFLTWTTLFLLTTVLGFLSVTTKYLEDLAYGRHDTFLRRLLEEGTGAYAAFLLLPFMLPVVRVHLFGRRGWPRRVTALALAAVVFSLVQTSMMAVGRRVLFPAFGLGPYDYGVMWYRYPMEFLKYVWFFAAVVVLYYVFARRRRTQERQLATAELEARLAAAQLDNLRLQLQPHFLFNTLNTISSVMYEDVPAADRMLTQLSELLRLTLRTSRFQEIPLAEELRITRLYLDLMQRRFEDKLSVSYAVDPALDDSLVPQLILQPLVENSLRHAWKPDSAPMGICVAARRQNGSLVLQVLDTGTGLGARSGADVMGRGLGLSNIRDRLVQLYGAEQRFSIANRDTGGAVVTVQLPWRSSG
jgi:signal transduction histidine kinase